MDAEMRNNKSNQSDCNLISYWNSFFFFFTIYFAKFIKKNCVLTHFTETIKDKCLFDRKVEFILYTLYIEGLCEDHLKAETRTAWWARLSTVISIASKSRGLSKIHIHKQPDNAVCLSAPSSHASFQRYWASIAFLLCLAWWNIYGIEKVRIFCYASYRRLPSWMDILLTFFF